MYCHINFKTKKSLKEAVAAGKEVTIFQPGEFEPQAGRLDYTGRAYLEGPHAPEPHRWYATATLENGRVVKVL